MSQKRCLTIQDYSCLGRCSLSVAIPTISACGIEAVGIPTAVLSNHTAFPEWTYQDLTDKMLPTVEKWMPYKHHFDGIYTGYLGNNQIPVVLDIIEKLRDRATTVFVDPAFADSGRIYPGFDQSHVSAMRKLITKADIILPNLTEACFLVGERYPGDNFDELFVNRLLQELAALGPKKIIITGVSLNPGNVGCVFFDLQSTQRFGKYGSTAYPEKFHGGGDLFASAFVSCMILGIPLEQSMKIAHNYVHRAMGESVKDNDNGLYYGPEFEKAIPSLYRDLSSGLRKVNSDED